MSLSTGNRLHTTSSSVTHAPRQRQHPSPERPPSGEGRRSRLPLDEDAHWTARPTKADQEPRKWRKPPAPRASATDAVDGNERARSGPQEVRSVPLAAEPTGEVSEQVTLVKDRKGEGEVLGGEGRNGVGAPFRANHGPPPPPPHAGGRRRRPEESVDREGAWERGGFPFRGVPNTLQFSSRQPQYSVSLRGQSIIFFPRSGDSPIFH